MFCMVCQHNLFECTCADIEERLRGIRKSPHVALTWCATCDNHVSRCTCKKPEA